MHSPEVRQKFIEHRAQGWSLVRIASELGIARSTLIQWGRQLRFQLQNQTAIELDDLRMAPQSHPHFRSGRMDRFLDRESTDFPMFERDVSKIGKEMVNKR